MPPMTFPNQRIIKIHREHAAKDFLGIKNENWLAASRDLGAHALQLYLYLAANRDNFTLALSPAALGCDVGMARSTYHDQFHKLVDRGYLVPVHGNTYEFYEVPQSVTQQKISMPSNGLASENGTSDGQPLPQTGNVVLQENIQINNRDKTTNRTTINNSCDESAKENKSIHIPEVAEVKKEKPEAEKKEGFTF